MAESAPTMDENLRKVALAFAKAVAGRPEPRYVQVDVGNGILWRVERSLYERIKNGRRRCPHG